MAAALAADSIVFAMRADPAGLKRLNVGRVRLMFTTIVAFTTPITAARRLGLYRATAAAATGGAALTPVAKDTGHAPGSGVSDARIATTAALGVAGLVREANPIGLLSLTHVGAAGGYIERLYELDGPVAPAVLTPGDLLVVSNPVAMDAAGTWQLAVDVDYNLAAALDK
jgi:hypothetical protein